MGSVIALWEWGEFLFISLLKTVYFSSSLPFADFTNKITNNKISKADISKHSRPKVKRKSWDVQKGRPTGQNQSFKS